MREKILKIIIIIAVIGYSYWMFISDKSELAFSNVATFVVICLVCVAYILDILVSNDEEEN